MKKTATTLSLTAAVLLSGAAAATAAEYPAAPARCGVGAGSVGVGGSVDLGCGGMTPQEPVTVTMTCTPAGTGAATTGRDTVNADDRGSIVYTTIVNTAGDCVLTAVSAGSGVSGSATVTATSTVTVQAAGAATGGSGVTGGSSTAGGSSTTGGSGATGKSGATGGSSTTGGSGATDTAGGSGLANTGADSSVAVWGAAGIGALALGTVALSISQRRKQADAA